MPTILDVIDANCIRYADAPALRTATTNLDYGDLADMGRAYASFFSAQGLGRGDICTLSMGSRIEFFLAMLGLWRIGAAPAVLNKDLDENKALAVLARMEPAAVAVADENGLRPPGVKRIVVPRLPDLPGAGSDLPPGPGGDDMAAVLFTSGSTGLPKGVVHTHSSLGGNFLSAGEALGFKPGLRWLFNIPFTFTSAICHVWTGLCAGCEVVALDQMCFPPQFKGLIEEFEANGVGGSPLHARWLADSVEGPGELAGLRKFMTSGDALREPVWSDFLNKFPHVELHHVYGMTELGGRFCFLPPDRVRDKVGSAGRPMRGLSVSVRCSETGRELPAGETGDVYASGSLLMREYHNLPGVTAETLTEHGLRTGDVGRLDEEGFLFLEGRSDDVFKSSGEKVSAVLIERTLLQMGVFADVAVIGVADDYLGMAPMVFFVAGKGGFDRRAVLRELNDRLPPSHVPHRFLEVEAVPRMGSGKVIRKSLRDLAAREEA